MRSTLKAIFLLFFVVALLSASGLADCGLTPKTGLFLSYAIEPKVDSGRVWLDVSLRFRLEGRTTAIVLPAEWQGQKELHRAIRNLEVTTPGVSLQEGTEPWKKKLVSPPGRVVALHYEVRKDWIGEIDSSSYFRVMLGADYFQVMGRNFLVYPDIPEEIELPISLECRNVPSDWSVVGSFSGDSRCAAVTTRLIKLSNGLFAGGGLRVQKVMVASKPVFIATRGHWTFTDTALSDIVQRILAAERGFWHDVEIPNYLMTLLPSDDAPGNYGGTALEDSFALFMGPAARLDFQTKFLLAHEMFHRWNAGRLGEIKTETPYWFMEGFTDYYARVLLLKAGLITASEYSNDLEEAHREYLESPKLHADGRVIEEKFFTDSDAQRLAYLRGDFLALRWDQAIRERSHDKKSLDDGMLALLHQASQKEIVLTNASLAAHFSAYVGSDATRDVQKYIDEGETLPFASASASASDATVR